MRRLSTAGRAENVPTEHSEFSFISRARFARCGRLCRQQAPSEKGYTTPKVSVLRP